MITLPYATVLVAVMAAAALGATGAAWVLCGVLVENRVLVTRARRWQSHMSHLSKPVLSTVDVLFARTSTAIALRGNEVRVRLALKRTERLLVKARRRHTGTHRLDLATPTVQRRFAGMAAGWLPRQTANTVTAAAAVSDVDTPVIDVAPPVAVDRVAAVRSVPAVDSSYRPIRTHRPSRTRRLAPRPVAGRPPVPRQRASRTSRTLEAAVA